MATGSPRVGDQRVLMVIVTNDPGIAVPHPAFGAGDQACANVSAVLAAEVDDDVVNARCERADLAVIEDGDARRFERVAQRRGEIAGGDHIAERGLVVIAMVDHGAAEAALLGDMNGVDRGGIERRPDAESFKRQAASVRKRERAGIASRGEALAGVGEGDVVAAVLSARASARPTGPARRSADHDAASAWARMRFSISSICLGAAAVMSSQPSAVTRASSSMRMPMFQKASVPCPRGGCSSRVRWSAPSPARAFASPRRACILPRHGRPGPASARCGACRTGGRRLTRSPRPACLRAGPGRACPGQHPHRGIMPRSSAGPGRSAPGLA